MDRVKKKGILTPTVYLVDERERKIYMEYLGKDAMTLKDFLNGIKDMSHPIIDVVT